MSVRTITSSSNYLDKLVALIPAEIVGAYVAIQNLVINETGVRGTILWVSIAVLFILIPFYLKRLQNVDSKVQIAVTMFSFLVWVYAVGGMILFPDIPAVLGTVALILWTAVTPIFQLTGSKSAGGGEG